MNESPADPRPGVLILTDRFDRAVEFAAEKHRLQPVKGKTVPYLAHLLGVCSLVLNDGGDEDEAIAALLHDAPEDQGGAATLNEIGDRFGERVKAIVGVCTDSLDRSQMDWRSRREQHIAHFEAQPSEMLRVPLGDMLYNATSLVGDFRWVGSELWNRFNAGLTDQLWYYGTLAETFEKHRPGQMSDELSAAVSELRRLTAESTHGPGAVP